MSVVNRHDNNDDDDGGDQVRLERLLILKIILFHFRSILQQQLRLINIKFHSAVIKRGRERRRKEIFLTGI